MKAAADLFVHGYDEDWNKKYPAEMKGLAGEVAKVAGCSEASAKALQEGSGPVAAFEAQVWQEIYRAYYFEHHEEYTGGGFWDCYPDMLASDRCRKGIDALTAQWDALLKATLTAKERELWQTEMTLRRERREKAAPGWLKARLDKLETSVRKDYEKRLQSLADVVKLSEAGIASMKPAVEAAVQAHLAIRRSCGERTLKWWDTDFTYYRSKSIENLEKHSGSGYLAGVGMAGREGNKVFDGMVEKLLTAEQRDELKKWEEGLQVRLQKVALRMADSILQMNAQNSVPLQSRVGHMADVLGMDEPRRKAFEDRLAAEEKSLMDGWKKFYAERTVKQLKRDGGSSMESYLERMEKGSSWMNDEAADRKSGEALRTSWNNTMEALTTPAERARWAAEEKAEGKRKVIMMAHMAVAELDRRLLLQPDQRVAIEKLAIDVARPLEAYQGDVVDLWRQNLDGSLILIPGIKNETIDPLLDESQRKGLKVVVDGWKANWAQLQTKLAAQ